MIDPLRSDGVLEVIRLGRLFLLSEAKSLKTGSKKTIRLESTQIRSVVHVHGG